ncbi:hypothetical protein Y032_0521g2871 [Ancylostoma ceylanicum]|uniref:Uncharacterized protein n=1 Tax=Ancylostoma ceylanicum TaxID=53326 RepID=A0A016WSS5_9BILA|nr:hypothetical protein Y032_0521g2871 [Ancylostoma ceylanicum]
MLNQGKGKGGGLGKDGGITYCWPFCWVTPLPPRPPRPYPRPRAEVKPTNNPKIVARTTTAKEMFILQRGKVHNQQ